MCDVNGDIDLLNDRAILSLDVKSVLIMKKRGNQKRRSVLSQLAV